MSPLFWAVAAFLSGSIPFSVIIGRIGGGVDVREVGDHNPGASNVIRALNWRWGALALLLDYFKAAVPVGLAWFFAGVEGWAILPVALAPAVGHAFSPWLRFRGGKAVAATFGLWTGLTVGTGPIVLGMLLGLMYAVVTVSAWSVMLTLIAFGIFVITFYGGSHPVFIAVWAGNLLLLALRHWGELHERPALRPWLFKLLHRVTR